MSRYIVVVLLSLAAGCTGDGADAPEPPTQEPWGGKSIDEPYDTSRIELVQSAVRQGLRGDFYRNRAYTCGKRNADGSEAYQTFLVAYPEGIATAITRPLWVRLHGGGVGAYGADGVYIPEELSDFLDEEGFAALAELLTETGLVAKVRAHPAGFRFMMPSLCDHDVYSGVGVPEPHNPNSPDEDGNMRAADGLLATKAALAYTREHYATAQVFLQGTSAGSIGAFSVAYTMERAGTVLSGIVMDSHVLSEAMAELIESGCTPFDVELVKAKVGPMTDTPNLPEQVVGRGEISVPIMHVWARGDPSCCGDTPFSFLDASGAQQTMGSCDYHHEGLRAAIEANPPGGVSENVRMCVNAPGSSVPCAMHSPTKIAYDTPNPAGDQDHEGRDYNQYLLDWVTRLLQ